MPRILCVTSNLPRWEGDSTTPFVLHLAQDLQALGWEVDLLAPHARGASIRERLGGVEVRRFRYLWPDRAQSVCYQGGALVNLRRHPLNRLKVPALVAAEIAAVSRALATRSYDLVHSHWILPQGFTGMLASALFRKPHVVTVHGGDLFALNSAALRRIKSLVLSRVDAVTVNSSFTATGVRSLCPQPQRLELIPMGVRTGPLTSQLKALAQTVRRDHRIGSGPLLLFLGRLVEEKGVHDLLEAMAILGPTLPDARLLVVGEGQDRLALEHHAEAIGIGHRARFPGWVDPGQVPAYLAAADCFIGPSKRTADGWSEAQGLVFAEAMAAGTPVIATRLGGIPDTVIDGETGILVAEGSPREISDAIRRLLEDRPLRSRLVQNAAEQVKQRLSREASALAFHRLFLDLVDGRRRPS